MTKNKTVQTDAKVSEYFAAIDNPTRRKDCEQLAQMMSTATRQPGRMWGPGIVGFGVHKYRYDSGREGEICAVGFASRKAEIAVYGLAVEDGSHPQLAKLGKHKTGKGCLYLKALADVDIDVLTGMIREAAAARLNG